MEVIIKDKLANEPRAYTYLIEFNKESKVIYYYGVRYANVKLGLSPIDDLFKKYFTSSKQVKILLDAGISPHRIVIHKTFDNHKEACDYECALLERIGASNRTDFLNQVSHFNNAVPYSGSNVGRILSEETKQKIGEASKQWQSDEEYRELRRQQMKEKWADSEFRAKMNKKNESYKKSGASKVAGSKSGFSRVGMKYSDDVKKKRSMALKKAMQNIDMSARAAKRPRHDCPECQWPNLDGSAFNSHMIAKHEWTKDQCQAFKHKKH